MVWVCKPPEFPRGAAKLISTDFSDMGGDGKTTGSPSCVKLFPIGWNWDKVRVLKFIADTHTKGLTLLQSDHFCCSRWPFSANNSQQHQTNQVRTTNDKHPACVEGGDTPSVPSLLGWTRFATLRRRKSRQTVTVSSKCSTKNEVFAVLQRNEGFVAEWDPWYVHLR